MAYEYDVFVSYAHADNQKPHGSSAESGWVTTLAQNLNIGPNVHPKKLFIDHQLKPGDAFSDDLLEKLEKSRLLLLLLTQNYIDSWWCGQELTHFVRTHANDLQEPADVFVVELVPFDTLRQVPDVIQEVRKRLIHAKFWHQPPEAASPVPAGYPTPTECELEAGRHYWRVLNELTAAIDSRLRIQRSVVPSRATRTGSLPLGTVLLADTTDDLVPQRDRVRAALEPEGVVVLPSGDYVGLSPHEFEAEIASDLRRSDLFVQLLSPTVGRTVRGFAAPLPQLQFDRAVLSPVPIMQWCERLPSPGEITDPDHARLFETQHLRATSRSAFESEVLGRLRAMKQERPAAAAPAPTPGRTLLFVDEFAGEPALNENLRRHLRDAHCTVRTLPAEAPLGNDGIVVQLLEPCRAGITVFADRAKFTTVYNRLLYFLNRIAQARLPVARWGLYLTPETVGCEFGLTSDELVAVDERGLGDFLRGL